MTLNSRRALGLKLGLLSALMGLPAWFNLMYIPGAFFVPGDASATARRILAGELTYRVGVFCGLISGVGFLLLGLALYDLFKDVDRRQARTLVAFVLASVAVGFVNTILETAPLVLLSGADYLSAFSGPQLDALSLAFLRLRGNGIAIDGIFWGLWLFPYGILVFKSGFFPRVLGVFLIVGCFAYLTSSFTSLVLPVHSRIVGQFMMPLFALAELPIWLWFFVKGVNLPPAAAGRPAQVS